MSGFQRLPTEILQTICEYLDDCRDFSLVDKACLGVARKRLFSNVTVKKLDNEPLLGQVSSLRKLLEGGNHLGHVRRLAIRPAKLYRPQTKLVGSGDQVYEKWRYIPFNGDLNGQRDDEGWKAVAKLLADMPVLADFVYAATTQLHPSILDVLQASRRDCRLHLQSFLPESLVVPPAEHVVAHPLERDVLTASNLHTVTLTQFDECGIEDHIGYNFNAVLDLVAGGNSHLKEVNFLREPPRDHSWPRELERHNLRHRWQGNELAVRHPSIRGSLTSLELAGGNTGSLESVQMWTKITDFDVLRTLKLHSNVTLETLAFLAEYYEMPCLETLALDLDNPQSNSGPGLTGYLAWECFWEFKPLKSLKLTGSFEPHNVAFVLSQHGSRLQSLAMFPAVVSPRTSHALSNLISAHCTSLEDLALPVPRGLGNAIEVNTYRRLGRIRTLRNLFISLDCSQLGVSAEDERVLTHDDESLFYADDGNESLQNIDVQDALVNHAIDETLALAIFDTITGGRPASASKLRKLKLRIDSVEHGLDCPMSVREVCSQLAGTWCLERSSRDDSPDKVMAKWTPQSNLSKPLGKDIEPLFRKLWPKKSDHWMHDWHSFPLCEL